MKIDGSVALVTGASRGLGRVYARELVSRGAAKVYGAARDPAAVTEPGVTPIALDVTDPERVVQVARQCADVSLLVNNAGDQPGIGRPAGLRRCRGRPDRSARRRAVPVRQGIAVARSRADLPAHPGVLGRCGEGHPLAQGSWPVRLRWASSASPVLGWLMCGCDVPVL